MIAISERPSTNPSSDQLARIRAGFCRGRMPRVAATAVLMLVFLCAASFPLIAQSAYYSGVTTTLISSGVSGPFYAVEDAQGNLYVADTGNKAVKEYPLSGGSYGSPTTLAAPTLGYISPFGVAVDSSGDVWVADFGNGSNGQVYEIVKTGGVLSSTVKAVGSSWEGPASFAADTHGNVWATDFESNSVWLVSGTSPTQLGVSLPVAYGITVDPSGNLYVVDRANYRVDEIQAPSYNTLTPLPYTFPSGDSLTTVSYDTGGNLFVMDWSASKVTKLLASSGYATGQVWGSGFTFTSPEGLFWAPNGDLVIADTGANAIEKVETQDVSFGSSAAGTVSASSPLSIPFTFTAGATIVAPTVLTQGQSGLDFTNTGGGGGSACAAGSYLAGATCIVTVQFDPTAPGLRLGAVQLKGSTGNPLATANVYGTGTGPQIVFPNNSDLQPSIAGSGFSSPGSVAVDGSGDVFVADKGNNAVKEIVAVAGVVSSSSTVNTVGAGFKNPEGVALDGAGDVFVADTGNNLVKEIVAVNGQVSSTSTVNTVGSGFSGPAGVAVDAAGDVFVADDGDNAVKEIVAESGQVSSSSTVNTVGAGFSAPGSVAVDGSGDVFVADSGHNAVKEIVAVNGLVSSSSTVNTVGGGFSGPTGVAVDAAGDVFVADQINNAVKEIVAVSGQVSSGSTVEILGWGIASPAGVALDASGDVFVADANFVGQSNSAVTEMPLAAWPALTATGATNVGTTDINDGPLTATVANNGNATLIFNLPSSADNPGLSTSNFTWDDSASTCTQTTKSSSTAFTLAEGASCIVAVQFTPTANGTLTDNLSLTDNTLNASSATQLLPLSGVAATAATMSTPTPGNPLTAATTTFTWNAGSGGVSGYYLWIGTSLGTANLANIGVSSSTTQATVTLPTSGATIYVQLWTKLSSGALISNSYLYTEDTITAATMSIPTPGNPLTAASTTFTWNAGSGGVTGYYLWIGTSAGTANLANIGLSSTTTQATVTLPTSGATIYVQLWTKLSSGALISNSYLYTEDTITAATMSTPTPGNPLTAASTTFTWNAGVGGVTGYYLWIGTSAGTANLANIGVSSSTTQATVTLPTNGATIYVELWTAYPGGSLLSNSYLYTEDTITAATMSTPTPGNPLTAASTTFTWNAGSGGVTGYYLWIGTSAGTANLANIGLSSTTTQATVTLPTSGATIYVQLWTKLSSGALISNSYLYTEDTITAATMSTPTPGNPLTAASTTFTWNAGVGGVTGYYLWIGTSAGTANLANIGVSSSTTQATVTLPTNGATIYVELWTAYPGGSLLSNSYIYTEDTITAATMSTPTPGSKLTAASTTFTWNAGVGGVTGYYLWIGTSVGTANLANIGLSSSTTQATVTLPTSGNLIYVELWTAYPGGGLLSNSYTYTEFTQ